MSNDLQNRLYNHEIPPPPTAWDKIAAALDDAHLSDQFPATLYELEVTPPSTAWNKIQQSLDTEIEKPVRRIAPVWRYAAAAAVITALTFGSLKFFSGSSNVETSVAEGKTNPTTTPSPIPGTGEQAVTTPVEPADPAEEARNDAALEESKHLFASLDADEKQKIRRVSEEHFLSVASPISTTNSINPGSTYREPECAYVSTPSFAFNDDASPIDMASRYVMLMTPDGKIVRISKKLGPLVCCVSGEESDEDCNNQLKKWREKLADPNVASGSNFLDILNLIHSFKENNP